MNWYECERTDAGKKVFSESFSFCKREDKLVVIAVAGGKTWFKSSIQGARKFFTLIGKCDEDVAKALEEGYQK